MALCVTTALPLAVSYAKETTEKLVFADDFNRKEKDATKEELGHGWSTNSKARAKGNKQAFLRDGTLHIATHKEADHAASVRHDAAFRDGRVEVRFMLEDAKDTLGLNFADMQLKTVHAGHLFKVTVGVKKLDIMDLKTGNMDKKTRELRQAKKVSPELAAKLKTKKKQFPVKLKTKTWYSLVVTIKGDAVAVTIDGKEAGRFASEGFAHPTKRMLRLAIAREVVVDDLKIYAITEHAKKDKP